MLNWEDKKVNNQANIPHIQSIVEHSWENQALSVYLKQFVKGLSLELMESYEKKIQSVLTTIKQWLQITDYYMTVLDYAFNIGNTQTDIKSERNQVLYLNFLLQEYKYFPTAILKDISIGVWFFF